MTRVVTYKQFSGIVLSGEEPVTTWPGMDKLNHLDRCVLLASQLEAPKWGTVQTYDGCGISGGIIHHTATFPGKQDIGSLWPLLGAVEAAAGAPLLEAVRIEAGVPYSRATGAKLTGDDIRELFNGSRAGKTPSPVPAAALANTEAVHAALRATSSKAAQVAAARTWLVRMTAKLAGAAPASVPVANLEVRHFTTPGLELALCVARSFVVNNPAAARSCYSAAGAPTAPDFAKKLYHAFATHGRWTNRLSHTSDAVERLGLWPRADVDVLRNTLHL